MLSLHSARQRARKTRRRSPDRPGGRRRRADRRHVRTGRAARAGRGDRRPRPHPPGLLRRRQQRRVPRRRPRQPHGHRGDVPDLHHRRQRRRAVPAGNLHAPGVPRIPAARRQPAAPGDRLVARAAVLRPARRAGPTWSPASAGWCRPACSTTREVERFLRDVFTRRGRSNDFRKLDATLYVVAVDLDSGEAVRFGGEGWDDVPISTGDPGQRRPARPVSAGRGARPPFRRWRAAPHDACLGGAGTRHRPDDRRQPAGAVQHQRRAGLRRSAATSPPAACPRCCRRPSAPCCSRACRSAWRAIPQQYPEHRPAGVRAQRRGRRAVLHQRLQLLGAPAHLRDRLPQHAGRPAHAAPTRCAAAGRARHRPARRDHRRRNALDPRWPGAASARHRNHRAPEARAGRRRPTRRRKRRARRALRRSR